MSPYRLCVARASLILFMLLASDEVISATLIYFMCRPSLIINPFNLGSTLVAVNLNQVFRPARIRGVPVEISFNPAVVIVKPFHLTVTRWEHRTHCDDSCAAHATLVLFSDKPESSHSTHFGLANLQQMYINAMKAKIPAISRHL
jgi:hypothetical protein